MATSNNRKNSKNHVSALIIALGVTGLVVITMLGSESMPYSRTTSVQCRPQPPRKRWI